MRGRSRPGKHIGLVAALTAVAALLLLPTALLAQQDEDTTGSSMSGMQPSDQGYSSESSLPATIGAGPAIPTGTASNVGSRAFIYTGSPSSTTPVMTTGAIQMTVMNAAAVGLPMSQNTGNVTAMFTYPEADGSNYAVQFTGLQPLAGAPAVGFLQSICGAMTAGGPVLPQTLVYMYASGMATITKDGNVVVTNQPAIAFVTQGLHSSNQSWLQTANTSAQEIGLAVPGPAADNGPCVPGFPNGGFYIYWPTAAFNLQNVGGAVSGATTTTTTTTSVPTGTGRGPVGMTTSYSMTITLNDTGITTSGDTAAGPYRVNVVNNSSTCRGMVMTGVDRCCAPFTRFASGLAPGASRAFSWYFPTGPVTIRDVLNAEKTITAYTDVKLGGHSTTVTFD